MTFLSGTIFSLDGMSGPVQAAIGFLPLTHTTSCIRASILGDAFPWASLAVLIVWSSAFFLISRHLMVKGRS